MKLIELIEQIICEDKGISPDDLQKRCRQTELMETRQIIMYFALKHGLTEARTGAYYKLDHATAHHAKNRINELMVFDKRLAKEIAEYDEAINGTMRLGKIANMVTALQEIENLKKEIETLKQRIAV